MCAASSETAAAAAVTYAGIRAVCLRATAAAAVEVAVVVARAGMAADY